MKTKYETTILPKESKIEYGTSHLFTLRRAVQSLAGQYTFREILNCRTFVFYTFSGTQKNEDFMIFDCFSMHLSLKFLEIWIGNTETIYIYIYISNNKKEN